MKVVKVVETVLKQARRVNVSKRLAVFIIFLTALCGTHMQVAAQVDGIPYIPDFSNPVIHTDCCPEFKEAVDNIMNNAPFVFEGRMIKIKTGAEYRSYLFEIEKVYRGGERLQAGTIELVGTLPTDVSFGEGWYLIFAKESARPSSFEANNPLKLEIFYHHKFYYHYTNTNSYFTEIDDYYTSGMFLRYHTKEEVRDFLATYNLFPTDIPKADTLKTLSEKDKELARKKAFKDAEEMQRRAESNKTYYRQLLEMNYHLDTLTKQPASRKGVEDAVKEYENASDSERKALMDNKQKEYNRKVDIILDANAAKKKSSNSQKRGDDDITLITSIQNIAITEDTAKYLEFDIMVKADLPNSYPYAINLCLLYESDSLQRPFKEHIYVQNPPEAWVTPGALFTGQHYIGGKFTVQDPGYYDDHAIYIKFMYGSDNLTSFSMPTTDTLYAHVKMKINGAYQGTSLITPAVCATSFYNTTPITDIINADRYAVSIHDTLISFEPPAPIITNYYINEPGNTSGGAGCGDILTIEGKNFGEKDITNQEDLAVTLAFKLGDFKTHKHDTIPYYKIQENYDYILWNDTTIQIKLPSMAIVNDKYYEDRGYNVQYPGTGHFKVVTAWGKEDTSSGAIEIKYAILNMRSNTGGTYIKKPLLIPKRDCYNGFKFQIDSAIAKDNPAVVACIKKAMKDWTLALDSRLLLELETDASGKPITNPKPADTTDGIGTISYKCGSTLPGLIALMTAYFNTQVPCGSRTYYKDNNIDVCNDSVNWFMDTIGSVPPPLYYSFYTAIMHEIGHILGLEHVIDPNGLMKTMSSKGVFVPLDTNAIAGVKKIIELSSADSVYWGNCDWNNVERLNSVNPFCNAVINVRCTIVSPTEIKVDWDSVPGTMFYWLEYSTDSTFSSVLGKYTLPPGTLFKNFIGLTPGVKYFFRLKAGSTSGGLGTGTTSMGLPESAPIPEVSGVLFVKKGGSGDQSGDSWANAIDEFSTALIVAGTNEFITQIWVSDGVYYPTTTDDRGISFELPNNVKIYGGFPANADDINHTSIDNRNFNSGYQTILSGDIGISNDITDNSYNVVVAGGNSHLDGFAIRDGNSFERFYAASKEKRNVKKDMILQKLLLRNNSNRNGNYSGYGAGIYVTDSANLQNLEVLNNYGETGGGIAIMDGSPRLANMYVYQNIAGGAGGVIIMGGSPRLENIHIYENSADGGGGIVVGGMNPYLENIYIYRNTAELGGGVVVADNENGNGNPHFKNIYVYDNTAEWGGGIFVVGNGNPRLGNMYVYDNTAEWGGGVIVMPIATDPSINHHGNPYLENMHIYENSAFLGGGIALIIGGCLHFENSDIHNNNATYGGGIFCSNTNLYAKHVNVFENEALRGGGFFCEADAFNTIPIFENSSIYSNNADEGGGICNEHSGTVFLNTLIYDNDGVNGATIYNEPSATALFVHSTITKTIPMKSSEIVQGGAFHAFNSIICLNGFTPTTGNMGNNGSCNAYFNDPYNGNYTLSSPLLTAPVNVYSIIHNTYPNVLLRPCDLPLDLLQFDLAGNPRVTNGQSNYGACEYNLGKRSKSMDNNGQTENQNEKTIVSIAEKGEITIKPNPTTGQLTIDNYQLQENAEYQVYSVVGQMVMRGKLQGETTIINVESLANGMYFLKVNDKTFKVVKQ